MTSNTHTELTPTRLTEPVRHFVMRFSSTPRGARLARRLAEQWLHDEGLPYGDEAHDALTLIVAELTTNAVRHGHVAGRDFRLRLLTDSRTVRVEVTDTRGERLPVLRPPAEAPGPDADAESGRGLLLVSALATRWSWITRPDRPGKTVWAEYALPSRCRADGGGQAGKSRFQAVRTDSLSSW